MIAIDTNVLVRYITRDHPRQELKVRKLFERSAIYVSATVLLETEWVLRSAYGYGTDAIAAAMDILADNDGVVVDNPSRLQMAIDGYRAGLDFGDALHLAHCIAVETFATFDAALIKRASRTFSNPTVVNP
jgi:predicted nucleic-acid-binding protein